jgi:TonB-linked SusC/RagA family outer membrane protein
MSRFTRWLNRLPLALFALLLPVAAQAQTGNAILTGKVTNESGQELEFANVYIQELAISVPTNAQGMFSINVPAARVLSQALSLRVRAVGYVPAATPIRLTPGSQTVNFSLKRDINRLSEVVVTGSIEGTERSKVAFSVGRLTAEDLPVPALDPVRALSGKVAGMRVAQTSGRPGSAPEVMLRGPTSLNATGRATGPLFIVDGTIMRNQSLSEIGGLDIESVEVVKGAAGASLYGSTAANGVIIIKTKRGAPRDGVRFNFRSEYGIGDLNSFDWGAPEYHHLQLDETGQRFCVQGSGAVSNCSRTFKWMDEIQRINGINADTTRTPQTVQFASVGNSGELTNVFQSNPWPGQRYNTFAQMAEPNPIYLNSLDISGRAGSVRYFVTGAMTSEGGAILGMTGEQQRRVRVNLDYDIRRNWSVSISSLYNNGKTDNRGGFFGQLTRGAPAGTDYLARDTLGRAIIRGGGANLRGTGNGGGAFLYTLENVYNAQTSQRYLASISSSYTPAEWVTLDALYSYDNRNSRNRNYVPKGFRTQTLSTTNNFGNDSVGNFSRESMNAQLSATFRKQVFTDLSAKATLRTLYDRDYVFNNGAYGEQFVTKDIFTLSNTTANFAIASNSQLIKNMAGIAGANLDYKGRYIVDGTFRYDGSSLFGQGNRWAPFGRISAVWRLSEEPFFNVPGLSDFRLRASRGSAGNTPRFNAQYETYNCSATGCTLGQAGNKDLRPETTTETELGSDMTLFNRLGVEFTYAKSDTKNQLLLVPTPSSLGFTNQWKNAGTLQNRTFEVALNLPLITKQDLQWNLRGTYDRNRAYITELFVPEYFTNAGTGQGTGSMFLYTARTDKDPNSGQRVNRFGSIWGRKFYKSCSDMPASVQSQCGGEGKAYQVNDDGWVVWAGEGNSWKDGITKNLWQTKLPAAQSPWNYPLQFGHAIVDRPLKGEVNEGTGKKHIIGNALPDFRFGLNSTLTYKRLSLYGLLDGTIGHSIVNQAEGWGLLDFSSNYFDQATNTVENAKPLGYGWRVGGPEGAGTGGFYDLLEPNNYVVEKGSYAKLREMSVTYHVGRIAGQGDWTFSFIGRNLLTISNYSGYDPEVGVSGGQGGSGLINQVDAFNFPTLRTYTLSLSTRF